MGSGSWGYYQWFLSLVPKKHMKMLERIEVRLPNVWAALELIELFNPLLRYQTSESGAALLTVSLQVTHFRAQRDAPESNPWLAGFSAALTEVLLITASYLFFPALECWKLPAQNLCVHLQHSQLFSQKYLAPELQEGSQQIWRRKVFLFWFSFLHCQISQGARLQYQIMR